MKKSRTQYTLLNSSFSIVTQTARVLFTFLSRTVFIQTLGVTYLGLNGLLTSILSMLSLADLGVGAAVSFALYKPLAEENHAKVTAYMRMFERLYRLIGLTVLGLGVFLSFFLPLIIRGQEVTGEIRLIYFLFLINSVVSYFFVYKRTLIEADQQKYRIVLPEFLVFVIGTLLQICVLYVWQSYYLYLMLTILVTVVSNLLVSRIVDKHYPYLREGQFSPITNEEKASFIRNIKGMVVSKFGEFAVSGTDNLLMSSFISLAAVGVYSNYTYLLGIVGGFRLTLVNSVTSSIANLVHNQNTTTSQVQSFIKRYQFILYSLAYFISVGVVLFINPLIHLWLGESYLLGTGTVLLIAFNFFIGGYRGIYLSLIGVYGLYYEQNKKTIIEAAINVVLSLFFLVMTDWGIAAIVVGTILSSLLVPVWYEPYSVFKYGIKVSFKGELKRIASHYLFFLMTIAILYILENVFLGSMGLWLGVIYRILLYLLIAILFSLIYYREAGYQYLWQMIKRRLKK